MKQTKTLAQVANDIENGNNLHEYYNNNGATIKTGNFESFADFLSYYRQHYRPLLEAIRNGDTLDEKQRHTLNFMADDLIKMFWDEDDSDKSDTEDGEDPTLTEADTLTDQGKGDTLKLHWAMAWAKAQANPEIYRVIVDTNEEDPTAPANEFGRYYMVDFWQAEDTGEQVGRWVVVRSDVVASPCEVHRPNFAAAHGYSENQTQAHCRCSKPDNVTRWARLMIDAGRVTDIYADCY